VTAITKHLFYWAGRDTCLSCPAKCLAVRPWPHNALPAAHTLHRTPKRQWWPNFTNLWPGREERGGSQFCCAQGEGHGSWAQNVQAAERQRLPQYSQIKRDVGKGITFRFREISAFKSVYCYVSDIFLLILCDPGVLSKSLYPLPSLSVQCR